MHRIRQACWAARAALLSLFLGSLQMPGYIGPTTFLLGHRRIHIARRVRIFPGLRAEVHGNGRIRIEEDVSIGQDFHIAAMGDLRIGAGTLISGSVLVTDMDHEYEDRVLPVHRQPMRFAQTEIGSNCFIGAGAKVQAGTTLGDGCVVGANAVVRGEFPAHSVLVGAPARIVRRYDPETREWSRTS